jgi:hypothetical protein
VRFYVNGAAQYVTVNTSLANGGSIFNAGTNIWGSLVEKAYAQLQGGGVVTGNTINAGNSWTTIGNGGYPEFALEEVTGSQTITDFYATGGSWTKATYNQSLALTGYTTKNSTASIQSILVADLQAGDDLILASYTNGKDSAGKTTLVAGHAMSIYGFNATTNMFQVRNPWGTMQGQYWDTTFEVGLSTLLAAGDVITADSIGKGSGTSSGTGGSPASGGKTGAGASFEPFDSAGAASSLAQAIAQVHSPSQGVPFFNLIPAQQYSQNPLYGSAAA